MLNKLINIENPMFKNKLWLKPTATPDSRSIGVLAYTIREDNILLTPLFALADLHQDTYYKIHLSLLHSGLAIPVENHRVIADLIFQSVLANYRPELNPAELKLELRNQIFNRTLAIFTNKITALRSGVALNIQNNIKQLDYKHTDLFSHIYNIELNITQHLLAQTNSFPLTLADLGTGRAFFPALLLNFLPADELSIVATERDKPEHFLGLQHYYQKHFPTNLKLIFNNLLTPNWRSGLLANNRNSPYDIVFLNHVLEHLSGQPEAYLNAWLQAVKHKLVVSVPIENEMDEYSKHYKLFTPELLETISKNVCAAHSGIRYSAEFLKYGIMLFDSSGE
jgi:hypothetical protein